MKHVFDLLAFFRCSSGGTEEQCDPVLESEAKKNTACGMITDPTGSVLVDSVSQVMEHGLTCFVPFLWPLFPSLHWKHIKSPV